MLCNAWLQNVESSETEGEMLAELACVGNDIRVTIFSQAPRMKEVLSPGKSVIEIKWLDSGSVAPLTITVSVRYVLRGENAC